MNADWLKQRAFFLITRALLVNQGAWLLDPAWLSACQELIGFPLETRYRKSTKAKSNASEYLSIKCNYFINCERKSACRNECVIEGVLFNPNSSSTTEEKNIIWGAGVARRVEIVEIQGGWIWKISSSLYFARPDVENRGHLIVRK